MPTLKFIHTHLSTAQRAGVWLRTLGIICVLSVLTVFPPAQATEPVDERDTLTFEIQLWLARHQGVDPKQVEVTPLDARLKVPACPGGWAMALPFNSAQSVRARCDSLDPPRQFILRTRIAAMAQEVATAANLPAGHILQVDDMRLQSVLPGQDPGFQNPEALIGRELQHALTRGTPVRPSDLRQQVTIYRLARSTFSGDRLRAQDVLAKSVPAEQAPEGFWSGAWPESATINRALPAGHILRSDDWASMVPAVVVTTDIPRGTALTPNMLRVVSLPAPTGGVPYVDNIAQLAYSETVRAVRRGEPISKLDVRAAVLIKRGSKVTISVGRGKGFQISTLVEALEDGRLGEHIRFINGQSGRIISGVVTAANQAEAL